MPDPTSPEAWARELRLAQAADARSRRADWTRLGAQEATLGSTIAALARAGPVRLDLGPAGTHRGRVVERGPDHVRLEGPGRWCYLRLAAVERLGRCPTDDPQAGDGDPEAPREVERRFDDVLSRLDGEQLTLVLASGARLEGRLVAVGVDVLTLAGIPPAEPTYVSSSAVVAALGDGSG